MTRPNTFVLKNINWRLINTFLSLALTFATMGCNRSQAVETNSAGIAPSLKAASSAKLHQAKDKLQRGLGEILNFSLLTVDGAPSEVWDSRKVVGESSLAVLILGISPNNSLSRTESSLTTIHQNLALALSRISSWTGTVPIPVAVVATNQALLRQFSAGTLSSSQNQASVAPRLWDAQSTLRHHLKLQERSGITPSQPALVLVDRAGWVRKVSKVETAGQLQSVLNEAEDITPKLEVGLPAPDFALPDMNGVLRRPADLKGKKYLLLTFFPKCFTGTCAKQLESLRNSQPELDANDIAVWGVSVDPAEGEKGQRAFAQFLKLPFPLLPDTRRNLSILYSAAQSPNQTSSRMSVLIDKQGVVRWIDKQINPTTHGADVVAKVRELDAE